MPNRTIRSSNLFREGNAAVREMRYSRAIELYEKAIQINDIDIYWQNLFFANFVTDRKKATKKLYESLTHHAKSKILQGTLYELNKLNLKTNSSVKLSIIIPVYNSGKYLEKCLESVINQSFSDFELIIVNDGSSDHSGEIISKFARMDSRIVVITNPKPSGNPGTPRNQALEIARGAYIGFVDSDDWIDQSFYQTLMDKATSEMSDIVFSGGFRNHLNTGVVEERKYDNTTFSNPDSEAYKFHESFMIWDKIYNANLLKSLEIFLGETKAAVDVPFIFKAYYYANIISYCDTLIGYNYRRESDSSVTVAHRKSSSGKFEFEAYNSVFEWARISKLDKHYNFLIQVKMVSSFLYTLKIMSSSNFETFFENSKAFFAKVDADALKTFCINQKKWWLFKEFEVVSNGTAEAAFNFFEKKRTESKENINVFQKKKFYIEKNKPGIMFFPTWIQSNPYQKLFYTALSEKFDCTIAGYAKESLQNSLLLAERNNFKYIHLHWLHSFIDISSPSGADELIEKLKYAKSLGYKIIYTAHNIISHDSEHFDNELKLRRKIMEHIDVAIAHGIEAKLRLMRELGLKSHKITIVHHGHYGSFYKNDTNREHARNKFGIPQDAYVFLFFGNIRGYKGLIQLIEEFKKINSPKAYLLIAGRILNPGELVNIEQAISGYNILLHADFVADDDVQYYFKASNVCVLPYKKIVTSGAAMLSLTFSCPIIAPRDGVLPEIIDDDIGMLFSDYEEMREHMESYLRQGDKAADLSHYHKIFDWQHLVGNLTLDI